MFVCSSACACMICNSIKMSFVFNKNIRINTWSEAMRVTVIVSNVSMILTGSYEDFLFCSSYPFNIVTTSETMSLRKRLNIICAIKNYDKIDQHVISTSARRPSALNMYIVYKVSTKKHNNNHLHSSSFISVFHSNYTSIRVSFLQSIKRSKT